MKWIRYLVRDYIPCNGYKNNEIHFGTFIDMTSHRWGNMSVRPHKNPKASRLSDVFCRSTLHICRCYTGCAAELMGMSLSARVVGHVHQYCCFILSWGELGKNTVNTSLLLSFTRDPAVQSYPVKWIRFMVGGGLILTASQFWNKKSWDFVISTCIILSSC